MDETTPEVPQEKSGAEPLNWEQEREATRNRNNHREAVHGIEAAKSEYRGARLVEDRLREAEESIEKLDFLFGPIGLEKASRYLDVDGSDGAVDSDEYASAKEQWLEILHKLDKVARAEAREQADRIIRRKEAYEDNLEEAKEHVAEHLGSYVASAKKIDESPDPNLYGESTTPRRL